MRKAIIPVIALATAFFSPTVFARQQEPLSSPTRSSYELVVFEADGCVYCEHFRSDVLPLYKSSQIGRKTPIRFVNVSRSDETKMGLTGSITIAPTVVLMNEGQEIDRIVGYTGPFNFMRLVAYMMGRSE